MLIVIRPTRILMALAFNMLRLGLTLIPQLSNLLVPLTLLSVPPVAALKRSTSRGPTPFALVLTQIPLLSLGTRQACTLCIVPLTACIPLITVQLSTVLLTARSLPIQSLDRFIRAMRNRQCVALSRLTRVPLKLWPSALLLNVGKPTLAGNRPI